MIIPIRCFTCGKELAQFYEKYMEIITNEEAPQGMTVEEKAWKQLGVTRYCCKRMLLTHVDLITRILRAKGAKNDANDNR